MLIKNKKIKIMKKNKYKITAALFFGALCIITSCKKNDNCNFETTCQETAPSGYMVGTMGLGAGPLPKSVATIYNTSNNANAPFGLNWSSTTLGVNQVQNINPKYWVSDSIGLVFGIALDHNGGIYLSATDEFNHDGGSTTSYGPAGAAGIYYTNFSTPNSTTPLVTTKPFPYTNTVGTAKIPNSGGIDNSIGNIAYDYANNQLFATNLEDGRIYRINATTGIVKSIFDPFNTDGGTATPGMAIINEQLWGIGVFTQAGVTNVYFARTTSLSTKEIWSIQLDATGEFMATSAGGGLYTDVASTFAKKQIAAIAGTQSKITDIAFSSTGRMLLAERGAAHSSQIFEYVLSGTAWVVGNNFFIGGFTGQNSAGGVDYSNREVFGTTPNFLCNDIVWASGNYLMATSSSNPSLIYGVEGIKSSGNALATNSTTDIFIDYDNLPGTLTKGKIGDVEFFDPVCPCK